MRHESSPEQATPRTAPSNRAQAAASMIVLGLIILAVGHVGLYMFLTGDARTGLARLESQHTVAELESATRPDAMPLAGSRAYSPWLRSYERWHAGSEYTLHARHEGLVRTGMILSFVVGLCLLGHGMLRTARSPQRRSTDRRSRAGKPSARPAARPQPVPARIAPAPARVLKPAAVRPARLRKSA